IGSMLEEADRLASLVDNLLMLTRVDSGRVILNPEPVNLGELATEVADCLGVLAEERGQELSVEVEQDADVLVDRATLRQAMINLLDNAIKYTETGGKIRLKTAITPDGRAMVEIIDNGPGIAGEHCEAIFDRFYKIEPERSSQTGGVGLGLAIARHVVEINGGRIELESKPGQGSTFRIVLPAQKGGGTA
ncbi:MAG: hypothetical protein J7M40_19590, partial [Planctomycetes bacterium]|nr:hypothetical protein [Planctomycetota bacterium]